MLAVVAALSVPASAASPISVTNPLRVDINGGGTGTTKAGWLPWTLARDNTGAVNTTFDLGGMPWENPIVELTTYSKNKTPSDAWGSRDRSGGMAFVPGTGEFQATSKGFGTNYVKMTFTQLDPITEYKIMAWSFEARNVWSANSDNPDSKFGVWSTTNPKDWLDTHGYSGNGGEPNGYGPITPIPRHPLVKPTCLGVRRTRTQEQEQACTTSSRQKVAELL